MNKTFNPAPLSIAFKVIEYLTTHSDETLDSETISAKFDCAATQVHTLLRPAVDAGALKRKEDLATGDLMYWLGNGHPDVTPAPGKHPTLRDPLAQLPQRASRKPRRVPPPDLNAIQIEKGVTLPPKPSWAGLFERMDVGDSFALGSEHRSGVSKAITDYKKASGRVLIIRAVDGRLRIWRTE